MPNVVKTSVPKNYTEIKLPCYYGDFRTLNSVVVIPLKHNLPVLIFKDLGAPFYYEIELSGRGYEERAAINNYMVYWEGRFFGHDLPKNVLPEYAELFNNFIEFFPAYFQADDSFYKNALELPIPLLANKKIKITVNTKISSSDHKELEALNKALNYTKEVLRKLKFFDELTGKIKREDKIRTRRDAIIFNAYKRFKKNKGSDLPYGKILSALENFFEKEFRDTNQKKSVDAGNNFWDKYQVTNNQIWRIIKNREKKEAEAREWYYDNVEGSTLRYTISKKAFSKKELAFIQSQKPKGK